MQVQTLDSANTALAASRYKYSKGTVSGSMPHDSSNIYRQGRCMYLISGLLIYLKHCYNEYHFLI